MHTFGCILACLCSRNYKVGNKNKIKFNFYREKTTTDKLPQTNSSTENLQLTN